MYAVILVDQLEEAEGPRGRMETQGWGEEVDHCLRRCQAQRVKVCEMGTPTHERQCHQKQSPCEYPDPKISNPCNMPDNPQRCTGWHVNPGPGTDPSASGHTVSKKTIPQKVKFHLSGKLMFKYQR